MFSTLCASSSMKLGANIQHLAGTFPVYVLFTHGLVYIFFPLSPTNTDTCINAHSVMYKTHFLVYCKKNKQLHTILSLLRSQFVFRASSSCALTCVLVTTLWFPAVHLQTHCLPVSMWQFSKVIFNYASVNFCITECDCTAVALGQKDTCKHVCVYSLEHVHVCVNFRRCQV